MIDYLAYILVRFISQIFIILPVNFALCLGRFSGSIFYYLNSKKRSVVYKNLRVAFSPTHSPKEIKGIAKGCYKNFGQNIVEVLIVPKIDKAYMERYVSIDNINYIEESVKKGKGVIFLSFHFGSWEVSHVTCSLLGYPFVILVKPQRRFKRLAKFLESHRQDKGCIPVETGMMTREIIKHLKNNQLIGMIADQSGRDGMLVPFLNRTASLPTGGIRFALKFGTPVIPAFIIRTKGPYHRIVLEEPLCLESSGSQEQNIYDSLTHVKKLAEKHIREYPEQYFWFYKVWKYSKEKSIVVLSDAKAGHSRQVETVLKIMQHPKYKIKTHVVNIAFKNKISKHLLNVFTFLTRKKYAQGEFRYLRWFLKKDSYGKLVSLCADIVVSCGSSLAAVNLIASAENNARSLVVMRPGLFSTKRFDLAIIPRHDNPSLRPNVVVTQGMLNLIDKQYLAECSEKLNQGLKLEDYKLKIGILIGGDTRNFSLKKQPLIDIINQVKSIASKLDAELLITTSRRTSREAEELLKSEFKNYALCKFLIIANENNMPEAIGGILGISQIIIASADSISMVSEAANSGKYVVVFDVEDDRNKLPVKHRKFLMDLSSGGYINFVKHKKLSDTVNNILQTKPAIKVLNDRDIVREPVLRLF